ncbi:hypothetical protein PMAG_a4198 [Pseudoalteromonas mariniglutinosa NCIMB 1770]|nr:hypothetical protein [Pseudoalteromonas mariniglutinosa NCIMB 1770]
MKKARKGFFSFISTVTDMSNVASKIVGRSPVINIKGRCD